MAIGSIASALPIISGGASLIGGLFGEDEGGQASPTGVGGSQSGFAALPPQVQQAFLQQYLPQLLQQNQGKLQTVPLGEAPQGPFGSQGLQQLQNYSYAHGGLFNGTEGVNPLGHVEPLNQFQQGALGSFGGGLSGLQQELPGYQDLYNQNVRDPQLREIERQQQQAQNGLLGANARSGNLGAFGSSALGTQIAELQNHYNQYKDQAQIGAFQGANNLRNQTLQQMLNAGNQVQQQGQQSLNAVQPYLQQNLPQQRLQQFAQGLNQFPVGQVSQGQTPSQPNTLSKIGGVGTAATGLLNQYQAANTGYNGIPFGQSLGNAMPWL